MSNGYKGSTHRYPREEITLPPFRDSWIKESIDRDGIEFAKKLGTSIKGGSRDGFSTSQIRNVFGEVKRIQMLYKKKDFSSAKTSFLLLSPKIAYAVQRANKDKAKTFKRYFDKMHSAVDPDNPSHFQNFVNFLEAILAYHKAAGGN